MKDKIFTFLVEKRNWITGLMLVLAVACGLMIPHINVNSDMTKYLPKDSPMRRGVDRMAEAFPDRAMNAATVRAMYSGLDSAARDSLAAALPQLEGAAMLTSVRENGEYTLFELMVSPEGDPKAMAAELRGGSREVLVETSIDGNLPDVSVFIIAAALIFLILFVMCEAWLEPLLYLATIGVAVVINMGTNALLPEVSMTTNAIVAILQLVLSMDYSIILMNRYRQEKARGLEAKPAMRTAVENATSSVLASAFTTIAGMLMLCFMKFRIGLDMGIVLAKGVFCSIFCLYTVLPALIVASDAAVEKSRKRVFAPNTDRLAAFEHRFRCPLAIVAVLIFGGSCALSQLTPITFSTNWPTTISEQFPRENTVVLLYEDKDEETIIEIADALALDPKVDTVVSYPTLMLRRQTADEMLLSISGMAGMMGPEAADLIDSFLTPETMQMVYSLMAGGEEEKELPAADTPTPARPEIHTPMRHAAETHTAAAPAPTEEPSVAEFLPQGKDEDTAAAVAKTAAEPPAATKHAESHHAAKAAPAWDARHFEQMPAGALSSYLGFDSKQAVSLYRMAGRRGGTMSPYEFVHFVTDKILANRIYSTFITPEEKKALLALQDEIDGEVLRIEEAARQSRQPQEDPAVAAVSEPVPATADTLPKEQAEEAAPEAGQTGQEPQEETPVAAATATPPPAVPAIPSLARLELAVEEEEAATATLSQLVDFLSTDLVNDPAFASYLNDDIREKISQMQTMVDEGMGQLRGSGFSMAAIATSYPDEGEEIKTFLDELRAVCDENLEGEYYLIGESVMFDEMRSGFGHELFIVTLLTILAIFLIVAFTFRSAIVPTILIMTVLSGVYVNVFVSGIGGGRLLYLAYLIVQSILMGATIDYAILFTNYYREGRRTQDIPASLKTAYRGSIRTILTSGLIIVLGPGAMSFLVSDPTISAIVGSLALGGGAAVLLILFFLPALLAVCDRFVAGKPKRNL